MKMAKPQFARIVARFLREWGLRPEKFVRGVRSSRYYVRDILAYRRQHQKSQRFSLSLKNLYPCLSDYHDDSGVAGGHYFHQDLYVAQKIFLANPKKHIDVGSRIDGFIAHLLSFREVEYVDIRPLGEHVDGLKFFRSDATNLENIEDASIESISTLHAAEHFGLGRYGDPIDPNACEKFIRSLTRVLMPGGRLYFSVPLGRERLEFNAHRVFAPQTILKSFSDLTLVSFSAVLDDGKLYKDIMPEITASCEFSCGIFEFTK